MRRHERGVLQAGASAAAEAPADILFPHMRRRGVEA